MINTKRLRRELFETDDEVEIRREQEGIRTAKRRALETPAKQDKRIMIIITYFGDYCSHFKSCTFFIDNKNYHTIIINEPKHTSNAEGSAQHSFSHYH